MRKQLIALAIAACWAIGGAAQTSFQQDLWPHKPQVKSSDQADTARIYVSLPDSAHATGRAVIICPGGSYEWLAMDNEGFGWTNFFNRLGIATIVLKYRMPHGKYEVPISDAEQAILLVRRHAREWNINPRDIGIMGSSAGGHLASTVATHSKGDARPDFQILFYPVISMKAELTHQGSHDNLLGRKAKKKLESQYSNQLQVSRQTPRAFITLASDDDIVLPQNALLYYEALYRHDVPASFYAFPTGGHGFGSQVNYKFHTQLLLELEAWLHSF